MNYYHKEFINVEIAAIQIKEDNYDEIIDFINKFINPSDIEIVTLKTNQVTERIIKDKIYLIYSTEKTKIVIFIIDHIENKIKNMIIIDKSTFLGPMYISAENTFYLEDYIAVSKDAITGYKQSYFVGGNFTKEKDSVIIKSNIDDDVKSPMSINEFKKYINDNL